MCPADPSSRCSGWLSRRITAALVVSILIGQGVAQDTSESYVRTGHLFVELSSRHVTLAQGKTGLPVFDKAAERFGVRDIRKAFPFLDVIAQHRQLTPGTESLRRIYTVEYSAPFRADQVARALARDPDVIYAEPQTTYQTIGRLPETPNDPQFDNQAHLNHMRLPEAWETAKGEQSEVIIAIVDSGIHWQHEDLRDNVWTNPNEVPGNRIDDDNNGFVDDVHGWNFKTNQPDAYGDGSHATHGTNVAGVANAVTDNNMGIAGAAWNAKIIPINTACSDSGKLCRTLAGVMYAAMMGADIVNCSFGSPDYSETAHRVYRAAFEEGTLAVTAAGNTRVNVDHEKHYPSGYTMTLSVGGIGRITDQNRYNYGRSVNVFAPGIEINAPWPENNYGAASGTSMSAPLTSGVAALVKTAFPGFTPGQIREQIRLTADNIDAAQSIGRPGEFGRGRVNALRAVTENIEGAIRMTHIDFENQHGLREARTGDVVTVQAMFTNYLGHASGASLALNTSAGFVDFIEREVTGISMAPGDTMTHTFSFTLTDAAPDNDEIQLYAEIRYGSLSDTPDVFRIPINQTLAATHQTSALQFSITREGNIGYTAFKTDPLGQGVGFRPLDVNGNERDPLFEGGLLVATGESMVSNSVRGVSSAGQDDHFRMADGEIMKITVPGRVTTQEGRLVLTDSGAYNPIGVRILQESFVDHASGHEDFAIFKYTVGNETDRLISNFYLGLFFDWDVDLDDATLDQARFSGPHSTGWATDQTGTVHVGIRLLTQPELLNYRAINNPSEIYDGYTPSEKWQGMSGGLAQTVLSATDVAQIMASGPHMVGSGETVEIAFAMIAGTSTQDYLQNADAAIILWDRIINAPTATEATDLPSDWTIEALYPNPTGGTFTVEFVMPPGSTARFDVLDMLGRRVAVLAQQVSAIRGAGKVWDVRSLGGQALAPSVYFIRMTGSTGQRTHVRTRPLVVTRY